MMVWTMVLLLCGQQPAVYALGAGLTTQLPHILPAFSGVIPEIEITLETIYHA